MSNKAITRPLRAGPLPPQIHGAGRRPEEGVVSESDTLVWYWIGYRGRPDHQVFQADGTWDPDPGPGGGQLLQPGFIAIGAAAGG